MQRMALDFSGTSSVDVMPLLSIPSASRPVAKAEPFKRYFSRVATAASAPPTMETKVSASRQIESAIEASRSLLSLGYDWDGDGSVGYNEETWNAAVAFLRRYAASVRRQSGGRSLPAPDIGPGPMGSIDIHWESGESELLINIPSDPSLPATFYGDDYGDASIKGTFSLSAENRGLIQWLATMR